MSRTVMMRVIAPAIVVAATIMTSCKPAQEKAMTEYRHNPAPKQAYRFTMKIDNAPGPFAKMLALAQYDVMNRECLSPPNENGGHLAAVPTEDVPIVLTKVSDNEYTGTFYLDRMLDEDYHGRGVCHWKLMQTRVHLKATGAEAETNFIPSISDENIAAGETLPLYFPRIAYPRDPDVENIPIFGVEDRARIADISDANLFVITLSSKKEAR